MKVAELRSRLYHQPANAEVTLAMLDDDDAEVASTEQATMGFYLEPLRFIENVGGEVRLVAAWHGGR